MFSKKTGGFFSSETNGETENDTAPLQPSIVATDLHIKGDLSSSGEIHVKGLVEGDVRAARIVIEAGAGIKGQVIAEEVIVEGRLDGELRSLNVQLCAGCHVSGDILHEALAVENGAYFEGNIKHSEDPLSQKPEKKQATKSQQPAKSSASKAKGENTARRLRQTSRGRGTESQVVIKGSDVLVRRDAAE